jgi:hypothetical protein
MMELFLNTGNTMRLVDGSGVNREVHAPFCEQLRGKFPWLTLQQIPVPPHFLS